MRMMILTPSSTDEHALLALHSFKSLRRNLREFWLASRRLTRRTYRLVSYHFPTISSTTPSMSQQQEEPDRGPKFRKTRIVCVSDTHNKSPKDGCFKLPAGDVLVHAGDLTNQGTLRELQRAVDWIAEADYEAKIVVAGNHDITLDSAYYAQNGTSFHNQYPQSSAECISLLSSHPSITYLNHASTTVRLSRKSGPQTQFTVFGSPYSPGDGSWAFGYDASQEGRTEPQDSTLPPPSSTPSPLQNGPEKNNLWDAIPENTDVVITHTPPLGLCDAGRSDRSCEALHDALRRVRPRLAVCGHIHDGWGAELVFWNLRAMAEQTPFPKTLKLLEAGKKLAKVDLTGRGSSEDGTVLPACYVQDQKTCVVNAAIKARSRGDGNTGRMYNKPIVVDIDLPVWMPE